jgi:hypothetical protein
MHKGLVNQIAASQMIQSNLFLNLRNSQVNDPEVINTLQSILIERNENDGTRWEFIKCLWPDGTEHKAIDAGFTYFFDSNSQDQFKVYSDAYNTFYEAYGQFTGHYFRTLSQLLSYISNSKDEQFYQKVLRSQFSRFEIALLFINSISEYSSLKFAKFVIENNLLDGLFSSDLCSNPTYDDAIAFINLYIIKQQDKTRAESEPVRKSRSVY